jgi:hypothetical protein
MIWLTICKTKEAVLQRRGNFMTEAKTNSKSKSNVLSLVYMAMFVAIITVCAQIQIPMTVPFTLQTLGIFMAAAMLGWKRGLISVAVYVLLGAIGVPVFAGFSGGIGVLGGPTGGYIIGFLFTALIVGLMTDFLGRKLWVLAVSMVAGLAVCYLFGTIWFMIAMHTEFVAALLTCVVPFLLADAAKIVVATVLVNRLDKIVKL